MVPIPTSQPNTAIQLMNRELFASTSKKFSPAKLKIKNDIFYKKDLLSHFGCVNAIEFSDDGRFLISGGDDCRILLWNLSKAVSNVGSPFQMKSKHFSNVFSIAFANDCKKILSTGNDTIVLLHDVTTGQLQTTFGMDRATYSLAVDPSNQKVFATAGEDNKICFYDTRDCLQICGVHVTWDSAFHCVMFNPGNPRLFSTANTKMGAHLWDVRKRGMPLLQYGSKGDCMSARFNKSGSKLITLLRKGYPKLYDYNSENCVAEFRHPNYLNACTMKTSTFIGTKDEYFVTGSDNFDIFMWKISECGLKQDSDPKQDSDDKTMIVDQAHNVLKGHRSIVNQVRYHAGNGYLVSSGVEKLIKIWSPLPLPFSSAGEYRQRTLYRDGEIPNLWENVLEAQDYRNGSTLEDEHMMAYFDSIVLRQVRGIRNQGASVSTSSSVTSSSVSPSLLRLLNFPAGESDGSSLSSPSPVRSIISPDSWSPSPSPSPQPERVIFDSGESFVHIRKMRRFEGNADDEVNSTNDDQKEGANLEKWMKRAKRQKSSDSDQRKKFMKSKRKSSFDSEIDAAFAKDGGNTGHKEDCGETEAGKPNQSPGTVASCSSGISSGSGSSPVPKFKFSNGRFKRVSKRHYRSRHDSDSSD